MGAKRKKTPAAYKSLKILETGIELEKKGLIAYLRFAYRAGSLTGKNMFIRLAADEYDHMRILENIRNTRLKKKSYRKPSLPTREIERMVPMLRQPELFTIGEEGRSDLAALETALDMEKKSAAYYGKLARSETDPKIVELAADLEKWEKFHYDLLEAEMQYIKNSGFYFSLIQLQMSEKF